MPELPEVERARALVEQHCVGKSVALITSTESGGGPRHGQFDDIVCQSSAAELASLHGKTVAAVCRVGKQMWIEFEGGCSLLVHFGMTGSLVVHGVKAATFVEFKVHDEAWPPRFAKLELGFAPEECGGAGLDEGGLTRLAFCDPRRLGRLSVLRVPPRTVAPVNQLAPDPTTGARGGFALPSFSAAINSRSVAIKAALLDQRCAVCGVGNWIADEVLYQAKIHPAARSNSLSSQQEAALFSAVCEVVAVACAVGADSAQFPPGWLFHHRWNKGGRKGGGGGKVGGEPVTFVTVGGRTSAVVPSQRKGAGKEVAVNGGGGKRRKVAAQGTAKVAANKVATPAPAASGAKRQRTAAAMR